LLSIIIVNYNVKYFLEQCLCSVQKAIRDLDAEIIVIDNHSSENSVPYLQEKFPAVRFICNKENIGFAKANNQGRKMARGKYVLFLNPDTILTEDCLTKSIAVFEAQPAIGALGIRMIDGSGRFLPESKRGFPTPAAALFKLSGMTKLFPRSKIFAQYYLGYLPEKKNNETDVLSGAYMMVRSEVLEKTGGFDETFFMYGEDVDLSYRIREAGYRNYYLADAVVMHFKGESTRKDIQHVKLFYNAMNIFVQKHYKEQSWWFVILLHIAIWLRALLSFTHRLFSSGRRQKGTGKLIQTTIVGTEEEIKEAAAIISGNNQAKRIIRGVHNISQLNNFIKENNSSEIIFCIGEISFNQISSVVQQFTSPFVFRFHAAGSGSIVGSVFKDSIGEAFAK
jgi:GT2 family glycosyltransferase